jgi:hypothetical protein
MRCWEAAVIVAISPDGSRPQRVLLTAVLAQALKNITMYPPNSYDGWKFEYLPDWVDVLTTLDDQNLPPELFPTSLIADSLPPHHVPGRGTPLGALKTYAQVTQVVCQGGALRAQSLKVLHRVMNKLSTYDDDWLEEGPQRAIRLIVSIEEAGKSMSAQGKDEDTIGSELELIFEKGLPEVMTATRKAETLPEQSEELPTIDPKPVESLEEVFKFLENPQGRFIP